MEETEHMKTYLKYRSYLPVDFPDNAPYNPQDLYVVEYILPETVVEGYKAEGNLNILWILPEMYANYHPLRQVQIECTGKKCLCSDIFDIIELRGCNYECIISENPNTVLYIFGGHVDKTYGFAHVIRCSSLPESP